MKKRILALIMMLVLVFTSLPVDAAMNYKSYKISGTFGVSQYGFLGGVGAVTTMYNGGYAKTTFINKTGQVLYDLKNGFPQFSPSPSGGYYLNFTSYDTTDGRDFTAWGNALTGVKNVALPADGPDTARGVTFPSNQYKVRTYSELTDFVTVQYAHHDEAGVYHENWYIYDNFGKRVFDKPIQWVFDRGNQWLDVCCEDGTQVFLNRQTWKVEEGFPAGCYDNVGGGLGVRLTGEKDQWGYPLYGVYNDKGELQFTYSENDWDNEPWDMDWHDGYATVYQASNYSGNKYGLIDTKGNLVLPLEYTGMGNVEDGVIRAAKKDKWGDSHWGLMKPDGTVLHDFTLGYLGEFKNGIAGYRQVYYSDRGGYINLKGEVLTDDAYYHEGYYNMLGEQNVYVRQAMDRPDIQISSDVVVPAPNTYLADSKGGRLSDYYDYIGPFSEGLALVYRYTDKERNSVCKVGFIDTTGQLVIPLKYSHPGDGRQYYDKDLPAFSDGVVCLSIGKQGYVIHNPLVSEGVTAQKNAAKLLVNGEVVNVDAYNIGGSNYFKLRDVAAMLTGSDKGFNVVYNSNKKCVEIKRNSTYTPTASDLLTGGKDSVNAKYAEPVVYADGAMVDRFEKGDYGRIMRVDGLSAYNIGGSNYFKLRDLGQFIDFNVGYSNAEKCISIDTTKSYR